MRESLDLRRCSVPKVSEAWQGLVSRCCWGSSRLANNVGRVSSAHLPTLPGSMLLQPGLTTAWYGKTHSAVQGHGETKLLPRGPSCGSGVTWLLWMLVQHVQGDKECW